MKDEAKPQNGENQKPFQNRAEHICVNYHYVLIPWVINTFQVHAITWHHVNLHARQMKDKIEYTLAIFKGLF